jgi:hypothetical protein
LSDKTRMIPTYVGDSPNVQTGVDRSYARTSEVMIDPGSKTVVVAPYRKIEIPSVVARSGINNNWYGAGPAYSVQGCMPTLDVAGVSTVHPVVDPLNLFYKGNESRYFEIPFEYLPKPGLHHTPIVPVSNSVYSSGINFLVKANAGPNSDTSDYNISVVSYPTSAGFYVVTPKVGETYGTSSGSLSVFGLKYSNTSLTSASGGVFRGIKFPPFMGPARITGVYLRNGTSVLPVSSPFSTDRNYVGGLGTDTNLLHDSFDGPTFLLDVDSNGDLYFVLNADALDLSKAPSGTTFDNADFLVECVLFGYDRGFLQTNGRLLVTKLNGGSVPISVNEFVTSATGVGLVVPAPLTSGATNNEVTIYYSRSPYQGDVFGTQSAYSDDLYRRGPLTIGEANSLHQNPIGPVQSLSLPNKTGYEVLSATSFVTSLGTGRLSGTSPLPLLSEVDAPRNPVDYAGTQVDVQRKFSLGRVGFEDWATVKFPVADSSFVARPPIALHGLSELYDHNTHPEFSGCITRLPIGSFFRDKDFVGKTLYQIRSSSQVGSIPLGTLSMVPFEASMAKPAEGQSTWEGTEFVCGNASGTSGSGLEKIIRVDGSSSVSDVTVFKTTRGGAAYSATGPWPGGVISSRFPKARPNSEVGSVLVGTAFLVRSLPETVSGNEVHHGNELQMMVVTQAIPSYFRDTDITHSANGANEGYTAVDRFRILGRPLEKRRGTVNTSLVPTSKPLFQNKIFNNPLYYGSSDQALTAPIEYRLTVSTIGQTVFTLPGRPVDPTTVSLYVNGIKSTYGVGHTVGGVTNTTLTYTPSESDPPLRPTDQVVVSYLLF